MSKKYIRNYIITFMICILLVFLSSKIPIDQQPIEERNEQPKLALQGLIFTTPYIGDTNKMKVLNDLEEEMGLDITFDQICNSKKISQKKYILQMKEKPDLIMGGNLQNSDVQPYIHNRIIIPLDELIEGYAPHIKALFDQNPMLKEYCRYLDGHTYTLPFVNEIEAEEVENYLFINKTWLDRLGLSMPTTVDEFYKVLKAFKTLDPNRNGKADEIPFSYIDDAKKYHGNSFLGAFGIVSDDNYLMVKEGQVLFVPTQEAYKEGILYLRKLYTEGLLDSEVFTQDLEEYIKKGHHKDPILGAFIGDDSTIIVGEKRGNTDYVVVPPLKGPYGDQMWGKKNSRILTNQFMITINNQHPIETIKWIDQFFDPNKARQMVWGAEGITIEEHKGRYRFIEPPAGKSYNQFNMENSLVEACPGIYTEAMQKDFIYNPIEVRKKQWYEIYEPYLVKENICSFTESRINYMETESLYNDISQYVTQMKIRWISGERSIERQWNNYQDTLKSMNINQYVGVYQGIQNGCKHIETHYPQ